MVGMASSSTSTDSDGTTDGRQLLIWFFTVLLIIGIGVGKWLEDGCDGMLYLSWTIISVLLTMMMFGLAHSELPINQTWTYIFTHWF